MNNNQVEGTRKCCHMMDFPKPREEGWPPRPGPPLLCLPEKGVSGRAPSCNGTVKRPNKPESQPRWTVLGEEPGGCGGAGEGNGREKTVSLNCLSTRLPMSLRLDQTTGSHVQVGILLTRKSAHFILLLIALLYKAQILYHGNLGPSLSLWPPPLPPFPATRPFHL